MTLPDGLQVLADLPLAIDPDEVLRFQGYKKGRDIPGPDIRTLFDEALALGTALVEPRAVVRWLPVRAIDAEGLGVADQRLRIPGLAGAWGPVEHVALAICTIGDRLEARVGALWDARELPLAAMLDSVGSGAVESLAEHVNDLLCQQGLRAGLRVTNRVSPGYGAWDVAEQATLFRLCPGDPIGVTLNEASFMTPTKSISLLAGAGTRARVDHYFSQCARCWMRECAYRRAPARATVHR
ncbi:MAG TPA: hypothetical protein VNN07_05180 [Candidatus Tectomicrobia bacterium]|nr:hypothetical protein [Candidatus Tectomicrobia bacterium]